MYKTLETSHVNRISKIIRYTADAPDFRRVAIRTALPKSGAEDVGVTKVPRYYREDGKCEMSAAKCFRMRHL